MSDINFYSVDKLVEFGMSVAVANQMANSMNQSLVQMPIPGAGKVMTQENEQIYYVVIENKVEGPFSVTEISRMIATRKVAKESYVWKPGMMNWDLAENLPEILKIVALTPPPLPKKQTNK